MREKSRREPYPFLRKPIAIFVSLCFILSESLSYGAAPNLIKTSLIPSGSIEVPEALSPFQLNLPPELGTVQALHSGTGHTLIHIQTAHGNYEAQKKIQAILHYLKDTYGFKLLLLEGSASKLNPELLRFFPQRMDLTMKIAEELAKEALVKGDELFLLEEPKAEAYGIESVEAYRRNRDAFKSVLIEQEKTEGFLRDMDIQIERLTGPYLNKDLRTFLKRLDSFETKGLPLLDWLGYLKGAAKQKLELDLTDPWNQIDWPMLLRIYKLREFESKLDLKAVANEQEQFLKTIQRIPKETYQEIKRLLSSPLSQNQLPDPETGLLFARMTASLPPDFNYNSYPNVKLFIGHLILQSEVKGERLIEEINRLTDKVSQRLAKTKEETTILSLFKDYRLLKKFFALELTSEDYEEILKRGEDIRPGNVARRFLELNGTGRVKNIEFQHLEEINTLFEKALEFYQGTKDRDHWMLENIQARLKEAGQDKAIVITGGFHAGPFEAFFQSKGYNYALIAPKLTSTEGREAYLEAALQNSKSPVKKSTMDLPRRMESLNVQVSLGENLEWINDRIRVIRQQILKQAKRPVREGPPSVTRPRAEVRSGGVRDWEEKPQIGNILEFLKLLTIGNWQIPQRLPAEDQIIHYIVAIGASVNRDGVVSTHSRAVAEEAVRLYTQYRGKGQNPKIIFSGGYSQKNVSEAEAMRLVAVNLSPSGVRDFLTDQAPDKKYAFIKTQFPAILEAIVDDKEGLDLKGLHVIGVAQYLHARRVMSMLRHTLSPYGIKVWQSPAGKSEYEPNATQWQLQAPQKGLLAAIGFVGERRFFIWEVLNYLRYILLTDQVRIQEYNERNITQLGNFTGLLRSEWNRLADEGETTRRLVDIQTRPVGKFVLGFNPYGKATAPTPGLLPVRPLDPAAFNFEKIREKLQIFAQFEFFGRRYFMFPDANPIGEHHSLLVAEEPRPNGLEKEDIQTALLIAEHNPAVKFLQNTDSFTVNHLHLHTMTNVFPFEKLPQNKEEELERRDGVQISTAPEWPLTNVIFRGLDIEKLAQEASRLIEALKTQKDIPHWTFISKRQVVIFVGNSNPQPMAEIEAILGKYHKIHVLETVGIVMLEAERGTTETEQRLSDQQALERYEGLAEEDIAKALSVKSIDPATLATFLNQSRAEVWGFWNAADFYQTNYQDPLFGISQYPDPKGLEKILRGFELRGETYLPRTFELGAYSVIHRLQGRSEVIGKARQAFHDFVEGLKGIFREHADQIKIWEVGEDNAHVALAVFQEHPQLMDSPIPILSSEERREIGRLVEAKAKTEPDPLQLYQMGYGVTADGGFVTFLVDGKGKFLQIGEELISKANQLTGNKISGRPKKGHVSIGRVLYLPYDLYPEEVRRQKVEEVLHYVRDQALRFQKEWAENLVDPSKMTQEELKTLHLIFEQQWLSAKSTPEDPEKFFALGPSPRGAPQLRAEVRNQLTPEQLATVDEAVQAFGLTPANRQYLIEMWKKYLYRSAPVKMIVDPQNPKADENVLLIAQLNEEERKQVGEFQYGELVTEMSGSFPLAKDAAVTLYSLDGGLGEALDRTLFKEFLLREGLLSEQEVSRDENGKIRLGAKGTDLGFITSVNGKRVFVSIAEAKLLQFIHTAEQGIFGALGLKPLVNDASRESYIKLLDKIYLEDRLKDTGKRRTYRGVLVSKGIRIEDFYIQQDIPYIDLVTKNVVTLFGPKVKQPGGHGQIGFSFFYEPETWEPRADGKKQIRYFTNGDNLNASRLDPVIIEKMLKDSLPIVKLTTVATKIDRKGGKDAVKKVAISINGVEQTLLVPLQWEIAEVRAVDQEEEFAKAGQEDGRELFGPPSVGNQPFNTNVIAVLEDLLYPLLRDLKNYLGRERYFEIIAPTRIPKPAKVVDGKNYEPIDGAIGHVIHNLNEFLMTSEDEGVIEILERHGIKRHEASGAYRVLYFVNVPRTPFFTPTKEPFDTVMQAFSNYFRLNQEEWILEETQKGLIPPGVKFDESIGDYEESTGYYKELQNYLETLGTKVDLTRLENLEIIGKVRLINATLIGDVKIINETNDLVNLRSPVYRKKFQQASILKGQKLTLENVSIVFKASGEVEITPTRAEARKGPEDRPTGLGPVDAGRLYRAEVRREVSQDSAVRNFLTPQVKNLLSLRSGIFPLDWFSRYGKDSLSSVLMLVLGDRIAQAALESEKEKFDHAKSILGLGPKVSHAYIFGPEFALDDGGLAFVRTVFGASPAVVIVRNPKEEAFVQQFNEKLTKENRPGILVAHDVPEAQAKLRDWIHQLGGVKPGAFTPWGVVKSTEPLAVPLKQALRDNLTIVTTDLFNRFTEISGLDSLVSELRAQFHFAQSA